MSLRVLLTGATGGLGPFVLEELKQNHEVVVFSRQPRPDGLSGVDWVTGEITDYDACVAALSGVEAVQHIAGQRWPTDHPDFAEMTAEAGLSRDSTLRVNLLGLHTLASAAVATGVKTFVLAGSNCALGHGFRLSGDAFPVEHLPIDETHATAVEDSYSFSKLAGEEMLAMFTRAFGMRTYVTRIASIRDVGRRATHAAEVHPALSWDPWLWAWVASEDVARAHVSIMEGASDLKKHDVFFVNAADTLALEPTDQLVDRFRPDLVPLFASVEGHGSLISHSKLTAATGWRPRVTWRPEA